MMKSEELKEEKEHVKDITLYLLEIEEDDYNDLVDFMERRGIDYLEGF